MTHQEATINVPSGDSDEEINNILETPINEDFLQTSAPSTTSEVSPQTKAFEDITVESVQTQTVPDVDVAGPSSSIIPAPELLNQPISVVLPPSKDTPYAPFLEEPTIRWSMPEVKKTEAPPRTFIMLPKTLLDDAKPA